MMRRLTIFHGAPLVREAYGRAVLAVCLEMDVPLISSGRRIVAKAF